MCFLGAWFSDGFGSVRLTVGFDDLEGLFQRRFYDCNWKMQHNFT